MGRALRRLVTIVAGIVLVAGGGFLLVRHLRAGAAQAAPQYFTVPVSVGPVTVSISGTGNIFSADVASVTPGVAGTVATVRVAVGQHVRAGQTLFTLADTQGLAQQATADRAAVANAENNLQNLLAPAVDPRSVESAQLKVEQARLALEQAQAAEAQDAADLRQESRLTAPVAGTLQSVDVVRGQQVGAGTVVAVLDPAGDPQVVVPVPEDEVPYLPAGSMAVATVPSAGGLAFRGRVVQIAAAAAASSGNGGAGGGSPGASGAAAAGAGAATGSGSQPCSTAGATFEVTVGLPAAARSLLPGSTAEVVFTPAGDPPACDDWSATGTVTYPAPVTLSAGLAGTVEWLAPQGSRVAAGGLVAEVASSTAAQTLSQDAATVHQDELSLEQAEIALDQTVHPAPPSAAAVAAARLQLASAEDALAQAEEDLALLTVRAPIAGTVTAVNVAPGQPVGAAAAAVSIQADGSLEAEAGIDELDIGQVHVGEPAQVSVPAFPDRTYAGRVAEIAPTAQTGNGVSTFAVVVALDSQRGLLSGMSDTVSIQTGAAASALRVPAQAVTVLPGGGTGIVRVLENGKPVPVRVRVGLVGTAFTQILSGLEPGMPVIAGQASTGSGFAVFRARSGRGGFAGGAGFAFGGFGAAPGR